MDLQVFFTGLMIGLSLIVAIGAQNAFVLKQGLMRSHVFAVCLTCALSDALLIIVGVTGFRQISAVMPALDPIMRYAGAAFLIWYGAKSLHSAFRSSGALSVAERKEVSLWQTLAICLALTFLNPHVYLDTVVLLGSLSTQFPGLEKTFAAGAATGSLVFFFSLGYGARWLRPLFEKPAAWRILEGLIAVTMWIIAFTLLKGA